MKKNINFNNQPTQKDMQEVENLYKKGFTFYDNITNLILIE